VQPSPIGVARPWRIGFCLLISHHQEDNVKSLLATPDVNVRNGEPRPISPLHEVLRRIEAEYREMPGMSVTGPQAQRLWGLDSTTCAFVLKTLVDQRILRRTARGTYVKC
jgi:hypothetical protein